MPATVAPPGRKTAFRVTLTPVITDVTRPVLVTNAGDERLFALDQYGVIDVICAGSVLPSPFLDITAKVSCCGEDGLLGSGVPSRLCDQRALLHRLRRQGHLGHGACRVPRQRLRSEPRGCGLGAGAARPAQAVPVPLGGGLAFGPDGYLYMGTGDGGHGTDIDSPGDVLNNAQRTTTLLGKDSAP